MSYVIMHTKPRLYHKSIIAAGFDTLEKYNKELLQYCGERPFIRNYDKEEIFSDLILPRICRYIQNCRIELQIIRRILDTDLTPAANNQTNLTYHNQSQTQQENLLQYNIKMLDKQLHEASRRINDLPKEHPDYPENIEKLQRLAKQVIYLNELVALKSEEKTYLAFLRSCVRRTKIKYVQTINSDMNKRFISCDPTNGLAEISNKKDPSVTQDNLFEVNHLLDGVHLTAEDRLILIGILIEGKTFGEMGKEIGWGRMAAARRYQKALKKCQKDLDSVFCVD